MRSWLRWFGVLLATVMVLLTIAVGVLYALSQRRIARTWTPPPYALAVPTDSGALRWGEHVARIRGCFECHGEDLGGKTFVDDLAFGRFSGPNLTGAGIGRGYTVDDWRRAIRHGIDRDGRGLLLMPSHRYAELGEADLTALIAFLQALPPVARQVPPIRVGPVARFDLLRDELPLVAAELIDHGSRPPVTPHPAPTAEYGEYLARSCVDCHGTSLAGGVVPGAPGHWAVAGNLTPHESGLGGWTAEQFYRLLRTGRRPDDRPLDPTVMPWTTTAELSPTEMEALWLYLRSLPATPEGG